MATILVVDDHPDSRAFMRTVLEYRGHEVLEAQDGRDALAVAHATRPDLVITDLFMPVMDGYALARKLRGDRQLEDIPVLLWTAHHLEREVRLVALQTSATGVLRKPSEPAEILRAVEDGLGQPRGESVRVILEPADADDWINLRLNALIAAIRRTSQEREPANIVDLACSEARELIGAACAVTVILGSASNEFDYCSVQGGGTRFDANSCKQLIQHIWLETAASGKKTLRIDGGSASRIAPAGYPLNCLLAVPIQSRSLIYGWICLLDKIGANLFLAEDERVALAYAAQVAVLYESIGLQREVLSLNSRLKEKVARLTQANGDLEQFGYAVSHDLKEPLRAVFNFSELLTRRYGDTADEGARECVHFIREGVERVREMIDGLSAFYRAGQQGVVPETGTDAAVVMQQVVKNCDVTILETNASVTWHSLPNVAVPFPALLQILQNLVSNAVKYRRPECAPRIHVSARLTGGEVEFSVRDNGIGIAPQHRERVFELFQRLNSEKFAGLGLGLAMCARLVKSRGGRIWVDPADDLGSIFRFTAPAVQPQVMECKVSNESG